ncbi:dihydrolipoamide acetyltransferase family protein [Algoriphagus zhangzhouensis]|uniref:Dihydrolipoamide acetyltransferase component of pyruvate dehydrogenase complex n=1 Tax=Algoriphagus zhangzhouensis TaxID=1073327 RepID=A0A1M7Z4D6_9BACT|nr:dihydrolipoamide acetyltransferase family protein [Algoriphagus zhangzhouensis]TDY48639.1 2-oxoglutarate dehydrogenase E2 component (dihydrolipoamide succinyltransferase) [Algoriphagus zhangzhouensis]SHO59725.1 2-oxoglutarate dehydrogenase E2 component (dihydrolipoamide succinyltransferase) [Algoriphagus zhangzhouensis]
MASVEMLMPKMGESIIEGTILTWLKKEGDSIEQDESVLEVATDKVDTEVPATHAGVLKKILVKEGDVVAVGAPIAIIEAENGSVEALPASKPEESANTPKEELIASAPANTSAILEEAHASPASNDSRFYSPLVKSIAKEEGIDANELAKIPGTGKEGRVTKQDMLNYLDNRSQKTVAAPVNTPAPSIAEPKVQVSISATDEIIEMDRMRKMIAQRMVDSKRISAHVTSFVEADMTNIVLWREKSKTAYRAKYGESITYTPFFIEAIARAIRDFPMINISIDGDKIIKKKDINVGMAVALPSGNLIVPVIKNADQLNLVGVSKKVNDLANRARNNKLTADDLAGGTYTVSNVGSFGNVMGTPIIPQPQVAIMAVGAIVKKPAVVETPTGDVIAIRHKMFLSHSYDHRVVDGSLGGMFVRRVADYLEAFDMNSTF